MKRTSRDNRMRLKVGLIVWIGYVWMKTVAGLVIHPYRSIRRMVLVRDENVLLPVVLSPMFFLLCLLVIGRVGSLVLDLSGAYREIAGGVLGVGLVGLLLWQVLMLVLVWRFWRIKS